MSFFGIIRRYWSECTRCLELRRQYAKAVKEHENVRRELGRVLFGSYGYSFREVASYASASQEKVIQLKRQIENECSRK